MKRIYCFQIIALLILSFPGAGQRNIQEGLQQLKKSIRFTEVDKFYRQYNYQPVWYVQSNQRGDMIALLQSASFFALKEKDYHYSFFQNLYPNPIKTFQDTIKADIYFSDAALHFFSELKVGNAMPALRYHGLKYSPDISDVIQLLKEHIEQQDLRGLAQRLQPESREYHLLFHKLAWLNKIVTDSGFREIKVTSSKVNTSNRPLLLRLYQLGITDTVSYSLTDRQVADKLKVAQKLLNVLPDGLLRSTSRLGLDVPLKRRIRELEMAVNYIRWMDQQKMRSTLAILNIPSASFYAYDHGKLFLESRAIVGKRSTPTPTLSSTIHEVILYPYWMVPTSIATKELLPSIRRNPGYLASNGYEVLNKAGRLVDPYSINWYALGQGNFPYTIRQRTGCDNALGIIKFNFPSPYAVYLHDTPSKSLFTLNKRYFSHGCMRLEKPLELGRWLLASQSWRLDEIAEKGCLDHQPPVNINVERKLPLMVIYSTAWYSNDGVVFYDDVYRLNQMEN